MHSVLMAPLKSPSVCAYVIALVTAKLIMNYKATISALKTLKIGVIAYSSEFWVEKI